MRRESGQALQAAPECLGFARPAGRLVVLAHAANDPFGERTSGKQRAARLKQCVHGPQIPGGLLLPRLARWIGRRLRSDELERNGARVRPRRANRRPVAGRALGPAPARGVEFRADLAGQQEPAELTPPFLPRHTGERGVAQALDPGRGRVDFIVQAAEPPARLAPKFARDRVLACHPSRLARGCRRAWRRGGLTENGFGARASGRARSPAARGRRVKHGVDPCERAPARRHQGVEIRRAGGKPPALGGRERPVQHRLAVPRDEGDQRAADLLGAAPAQVQRFGEGCWPALRFAGAVAGLRDSIARRKDALWLLLMRLDKIVRCAASSETSPRSRCRGAGGAPAPSPVRSPP